MNQKAIDKLKSYWDGAQTWKNSDIDLWKKYLDKYNSLKFFCLECDILTIDVFREIERNIK